MVPGNGTVTRLTSPATAPDRLVRRRACEPCSHSHQHPENKPPLAPENKAPPRGPLCAAESGSNGFAGSCTGAAPEGLCAPLRAAAYASPASGRTASKSSMEQTARKGIGPPRTPTPGAPPLRARSPRVHIHGIPHKRLEYSTQTISKRPTNDEVSPNEPKPRRRRLSR